MADAPRSAALRGAQSFGNNGASSPPKGAHVTSRRTKNRSHKRPLGYICIWGTAPKEEVTDPQGLAMECPRCGENTRMIGKKVSRYCTVFYIPLFSQGEEQEFFECSRCGGQFQGSIRELRSKLDGAKAEREELLARARKRFIEHPEDLDNTCEMLGLYAALERVDEAIEIGQKAAATNPGHANLQILLGRLLLSKDRDTEALAAFDRALAANPQHAGAHFFKAVALAQGGVSDPDAAIKEARQADALGHPEASSLIRALEQRRKAARG